MKEHQARALDLGLKEFDKVVTRRRRVRRGAGFAAIVLVAGAAAFFLLPTPSKLQVAIDSHRVDTRPLPAYVEVITDDTHLALQLEVANACERVARRAGHVYIVECTASHEPGIDPLAPQ